VAKKTNSTQVSVIDQIRIVFKVVNWLPLLIGSVLGGTAPALTFTVAHYLHPLSSGAAIDTWGAWVSIWTPVVVAGLTFSGITVYQWFEQAFKIRAKALGLVVLIETVMTCATSVPVMCYLALGLLVTVNAVATATTLALNAKPVRKTSAKAKRGKNSAKQVSVQSVKVSNHNGMSKAA
jgi:phosphoglycerol transferase MdoB-like AlkP superfamily enzyme